MSHTLAAPETALLALAEDFLGFCAWAGIELYPWQREAFGQACQWEGGRFVHRLAGVSVPRGNGKSYAAAAVALWRLLTGPPPQDILSVALDYEGAKVLLDHGKAMVRAHSGIAQAVDVRVDQLLVPSTGSRWQIKSREHRASRGLHPDLVCYDECGWALDDELFASLLAAQASAADPLMLVVSTVGRRQAGPLWQVQQLAAGDDPGSFFWHSGENLSPRVTAEFLARQKRLLLPQQFAREHENCWLDGSDAFVTVAEVDAAMNDDWVETPAGEPGREYALYVDLGAVHDPTVIGVGHEEDGLVCVDRLVTLQGSREAPVQLTAVERIISELMDAFEVREIRVESWQGLGLVQSLRRRGWPVELDTPTAKSNAEAWGLLKQRLASRSLVLPPHARLREELLGLTYKVGPMGLRVTDRGGVHQDHVVVVRGLCRLVTAWAQVPTLELWGG